MTSLRTLADEYLALRHGLGYKLVGAGRLLASFVAYHERTGAPVVTAEMMLTWAKQPAAADPNWWYRRLGVVRDFALYLRGVDPTQEVPPRGLLPARAHRPTPYIYSDADVVSLIAAASDLPRPWQRATFPTLIGLLAVTGMRSGEALSLDREDVDWGQGLLILRSTKSGKSRELVLHPTTVDALRIYDGERRRFCPRPRVPAFFMSETGIRLYYNMFHGTYLNLVRQVGLERSSAGRRPRPHDLRHTFAVSTLLSWYRAGVDVTERMHLLSTYLGHSDPADTYWYLSAAPELMAIAAERLERSQEES